MESDTKSQLILDSKGYIATGTTKHLKEEILLSKKKLLYKASVIQEDVGQ